MRKLSITNYVDRWLQRPESGSVSFAIYLIITLCFLYALLYSMILLIVPLYALEMGGAEAVLGGLVAVFGTSGVLLSLPGAVLCGRLGLRPVIVLSFGLFTAANLLNWWAAVPILLLPGHFMAGIGELLFAIAGFAYLAETVPQSRQGLAHSVAFTSTGVGWMAGSALGGTVAEGYGFRAVFVLGALIGVAAISLSLGLSRISWRIERAEGAAQDMLSSYRAGYRLAQANHTVCFVALITILATVGWYTFSSSFYLDYLYRLGLTVGTIGLLRTLGAVARVVSPLAYYLFSRWVGSWTAIIIGVLFGAVGLAVTPLLKSVGLLAIVGMPAQMANFFYLPGVYILMRQGVASRARPTAIAVQNTSWAAAAFFAGPSWAWFVQKLGLSATFWVAGLLIVLGSAVLYVRVR
jgi:predicted MFS family arabinose efflux permease